MLSSRAITAVPLYDRIKNQSQIINSSEMLGDFDVCLICKGITEHCWGGELWMNNAGKFHLLMFCNFDQVIKA